MLSSFPLPLSLAVPKDAISVPSVCYVETSPRRLATLVAPSIIVMARHYTPPSGSAVVFTTSSGLRVTSVAGPARSFGDALFVRLNDPINDVTPAKIATLSEIRTPGRKFVAVGLNNLVDLIAGETALKQVYASGTLAKFVQTEKARLQAGDSGAPVFAEVDGEYKLVGTNYSISPTEYFSNLVANYASQIPNL